jgi:ectoine hydroxylase-related dioxygenase (phytanoyl-CoA dioxygenase family)
MSDSSLSKEQVDFFHENGYLVIEGFASDESVPPLL